MESVYLLYVGIFLFSVSCAKPTNLSNGSTVARKSSANPCETRFTSPEICVDVKWEVRPTEDTLGSFIFTFTDPLTGDLRETSQEELPKVTLWMPAMGHGSSPVIVEKVSIGIYRAKEVYFSMKGGWEIRFQKNSEQAIYAIQI